MNEHAIHELPGSPDPRVQASQPVQPNYNNYCAPFESNSWPAATPPYENGVTMFQAMDCSFVPALHTSVHATVPVGQWQVYQDPLTAAIKPGGVTEPQHEEPWTNGQLQPQVPATHNFGSGNTNQVETATQPSKAPKPKSFFCYSCGKGFDDRSQLIRHERIHTGDRPYLCTWPGCGRRFTQACNRATHMNRHTGEKGKKRLKNFHTGGNLLQHQPIHANGELFVCRLDNCGNVYIQKDNLKDHQIKYHKKAVMAFNNWNLSPSQIDNLPKRKLIVYLYMASLYKDSYEGIKGRGQGPGVKEANTANGVLKSSTAASSNPVWGSRHLRVEDDSSNNLLPNEHQLYQGDHDTNYTGFATYSSVRGVASNGLHGAHRRDEGDASNFASAPAFSTAGIASYTVTQPDKFRGVGCTGVEANDQQYTYHYYYGPQMTETWHDNPTYPAQFPMQNPL